MRIRKMLAVLTPVCLTTWPTIAADLYWTNYATDNTGGIFHADQDLLQPQPVISSGLITPYRLSIDPVDQKMYWSSSISNPSGGVRRANLDGSSIETIAPGGQGSFLGLGVDAQNRKLVWSRGAQLFR